MYLSQLEIFGFKSFPEKTTLEFNGDVTAVVGPNGCGKTNILDSIRWVLGEQRTSTLRSSKMEEVIFNGTAQMKPLGMAEVNLTIKNNRGVLPIDYDEVVITRRLFRSGESEYLLNRSQCRLKDIMELFYDTGMGPHAYSVIQQGMIDAILSDKAEDRRGLFEEASGVTKYKHRKKEAIAKLEATRADLLRLGDIIGEIEKQVAQLRRQAAKARQFGRFKDELKVIELTLAAGELFETQAKAREFETQKESLRMAISGIEAEFEKREINLQETRLRIAEHERLASERRQKQAELSSKASEIEGEIKLSRHRAETAAQEIEKGRGEIEALRSRITSLQNGIGENLSSIENLNAQRSLREGETSKLEAELQARVAELLPRESAVNVLRQRNSAAAERISALKAEAASIDEMRRGLELKLREIQSGTVGIEQTRNADQDGLASLERRGGEIEVRIREAAARRQELNKDTAGIETALNQLREQTADVRAEISGLSARRELLGQLVETGEGYSSGARTLMTWDEKPAGMMSPLAEVLQVPERYRTAISAALGSLVEVIPVKGIAEAEAGIRHLEQNGGGRASFLVLDRIDLGMFGQDRPNGVAGFLGFADGLVGYPDEYRLAVSLLLGRVAVFENRETILAADGDWKEFSLVGLDGYHLAPAAIVSGGKATQTALGRRQDIEETSAHITRLTEIIAEYEAELNDKLSLLDKRRGELAALDNSVNRLEDEKKKFEAELGQLKFDFRERENKYAAAVVQARGLSDEMAGYDRRLERIQAEAGELDSQYRNGLAELDAAAAELMASRNSVSQLESRLTESRIEAIEHDSRVSKLQSDIAHGRELCSEAEKMIYSYEENIKKAEETIRNSTSGKEELETALYDVFAERRDVQTGLREIEDKITVLMEDTGRIDDELSLHRKEKDRLTTNLHSLDLESQALESSRRAIVDRLRMEFGAAAPDPGPLPEGKTVDSLRGEADEVRHKLQRMDQVNLMAAEDYEREKDRLDFLIRQRDDLLRAEESLKEAIARINTTAEERFRETYAKIQGNFQNVFMTLFEGGEARLELENEADPLESPIRILARPGGKRLLSVAQLSGGERALTAISLLFAIYLVKPSPFCILDEVDAPLDDANLMRFLRLIKRFSEGTQFIIITHNKLTMEASDILYGVTMETPGVSKVVSVRFGNGNGNGGGDNGGND